MSADRSCQIETQTRSKEQTFGQNGWHSGTCPRTIGVLFQEQWNHSRVTAHEQ